MKKLGLLSSALFVLGLLMGGSSQVFAYEEGEVNNGGTITGKVILKGKIPEPRVFPIVLYPFGTFCKKISNGEGLILLKEFNVDSDGGLQDAVVAVQKVDKGKPFPDIKNDFIAIDCMFHPADVPESEQFEMYEGHLVHVHPLVGVLKNDQELTVVNRDPIIHNGQVFQKQRGNIVLNFPLPVSDQSFGGIVHFDRGRTIMQMICGMHEFMQTWGWMVDNPYYAKTKKAGEFVIDQIPPGTYKVTAWHPHIKPVVKEVTIPANSHVSLDFEFDGDEVVRPHYETQDKFRIGPDAMPDQHLEGCTGPFCVRE